MRRVKGSFTIEAVIWIPLILCMMISILHQGIDFYFQSTKKEFSEDIENWEGVTRFYELWALKELEEEIENE